MTAAIHVCFWIFFVSEIMREVKKGKVMMVVIMHIITIVSWKVRIRKLIMCANLGKTI